MINFFFPTDSELIRLSSSKNFRCFNTADGNIIDQIHLTKLMNEKKVFAFLDVYPGLPRKDVLGLEMECEKDWKIRDNLKEHLLTYRAGWRTQESVRVKTYKLLGHMINYLLRSKDEI